MGLTADLLGSAQEDPTAIAAIAAGEVRCILATPETLLNNPVHRNMLLLEVRRNWVWLTRLVKLELLCNITWACGNHVPHKAGC